LILNPKQLKPTMGSRKTELLKDSAYKTIGTLVKRFEEQLSSYIKPTYKEAQTREDFINPFFKALGWDVDNSQLEAAEAYREVMYEDSDLDPYKLDKLAIRIETCC
jgi:hypothetical protein